MSGHAGDVSIAIARTHQIETPTKIDYRAI
jgi:hypothetical protein